MYLNNILIPNNLALCLRQGVLMNFERLAQGLMNSADADHKRAARSYQENDITQLLN